MGLAYYNTFNPSNNRICSYEAVPWFAGLRDTPGQVESLSELEGMLKRKNLTADISYYFLYEAADAVLRIENCQVNVQAVVLQMLADFYTCGTQLQRLLKLFQDQPIPKEKLILTVPTELIAKTTKANLEIMERYLRNGICLLADQYDPALVPMDKLKAMGFTHLRFAPELYLKQETANTMNLLRQQGFTIVGGNADTHDILGWLAACGAVFMSGTMTGVPVSEDELIRDSLAREK